MKRKKISPTLEKVARGIRDSDEFVGHIGSIADRYRHEHALATGPRGREVRQTLKGFRKHAGGLTAWLKAAQTRPNSLEYEALAKIGTVMRSAPNQMLVSSANLVGWLEQADRAAETAAASLAAKGEQNAPRVAVEALRATFERHGLKWSTQVTKAKASDAVTLLCAIAKSAGDAALTPQSARDAMIAAHPPKY